MKLYAIDASCSTSLDVIRSGFDKLKAEGHVKDSFLDACVNREKEYPTGLPTEIPVAIPHTFAEHVISPAICLVRLRKPVLFFCMGEEGESVEVSFAFVIAFQQAGDQTSLLKKLLKVAQSADTLHAFKEMSITQLQDVASKLLDV